MAFRQISVNAILVISCSLLILHSQLAIAQIIKLYSEISHAGTVEKVDISKCSNLPSTFLDQAYSIDTNGSCAQLFDGPDCTGNSIEIFANSPSHYNLATWRFSEKTKSAGPCRDSCDAEIIGPPLKDGESFDLEIFTVPNQNGPKAHLKVGGCTKMPMGFQQVASVYTFGRCFDLYNNAGCLNEGANVARIELRPGTPTSFYNNLGNWGLKVFKAASHCSYKCNNLTLPNGQKSNYLGESTNSNQCSVSTIITVILIVAAASVLLVVITFIVFFVILRKKYSWRIQKFLLGTGRNSDPDYELNYQDDINLDGEVAVQYEPYKVDSSDTNSIWQISNLRFGAEEFGDVYGYLTDATGCDN